jgi:aminoglycoside phosphotransferase (APT) family kinase protein
LPGNPLSCDLRAVERADIKRLADWLEQKGIGDGAVASLTELAGGTQNALYRVQTGGQCFVLRKPGANARPDADNTIRREARVLAALEPTKVPHARLRGLCVDRAVLGTAFLLTDAVEGFNPCVTMPPQAIEHPALRHRMGLSMVDGLVALASLDPAGLGLSDFGRIEGFVDRQVDRWASQLDSYRELPAWPGPQVLPGIDEIGSWLTANRPAQWQGGLMHGDYHLANVLFDEQGRLAAVLDWELSTLGDPLLDLGRLLAAWPDPDGTGPLSLKVEPWHGFPDRDELAERYAGATGRNMAHLLWYEVLACYKLAIILEGTHARACGGLAAADVGARLHASALALLSRAQGWMEARA